ncbi:MAG: N-acetylmuramoyl-L-alanine amidase [Bacteroidales bacterium]|nr:N-acetylmuramoyl-L-alanine amidase [Bacteroidales bacterium]
MKRLGVLILALALGVAARAEGISAREFRVAADSLRARLERKTTVKSPLRLEKVMKREGKLDFYFSKELSDFPMRTKDAETLRKDLEKLLPKSYSSYGIGEIFGNGTKLEDLVTPELGSNGRPAETAYRVNDRRSATTPLVSPADGTWWKRGLSGRHIALWQSHGRYWEPSEERWEWQRAALMGTVEDMYTQSYVLPFLIPMLENAGAIVMTPRERDTQVYEVVCDNDPAFEGPRIGPLRRKGTYSEKGHWKDAGEGFADPKPIYSGKDNPFKMGTARMSGEGKGSHSAEWTPDIPERGFYAVYVSYKTVKNSTSSALYTVKHMGGESAFYVNQTMGGGTFVYLGTFEFDKGTEGCVTLSAGKTGGVLTADAVRFGGGMGKIARGEDNEISGLPAFAEGAMYNLLYSGFDSSFFDDWDTEYVKEYACRGSWVSTLAGGSRMNPKHSGKKIPVDLSLAFHSDAGVTPNDSIVGTLSIYTRLCNGSDELPGGEKRLSGRFLAETVQSQVVEDIRRSFEPKWSRRQIWDRSYSESRTSSVPAMLLELLSHQNFADMRYGLDPTFRFTVSRAVYKGILKYLSGRYGCGYSVQPLPVKDFKAMTEDGKVRLSWSPTSDPEEPTAKPKGYFVYTRKDDGAFDAGVKVEECSYEAPIEPGTLYSFKIAAFNEGGLSFPSEVLSVGSPKEEPKGKVLVVNNFTRVSGPAWFDTPQTAGFSWNDDGGVPWGYGIEWVGEQYEFRRSMPWIDDDDPGYGASFVDKAGMLVAGNTFDFVSLHAAALMDSGYEVVSSSLGAFKGDEDAGAVDVICGKQILTRIGRGAFKDRFPVYPEKLIDALFGFVGQGKGIIISGSALGKELRGGIYEAGSEKYRKQAAAFAEDVLGFKPLSGHASRSGEVFLMKKGSVKKSSPMPFPTSPNPKKYCVEAPDGLSPARDSAKTFMRYTDSMISAGVLNDNGAYRTVSLGFPLELLSPSDLSRVMSSATSFIFKEE